MQIVCGVENNKQLSFCTEVTLITRAETNLLIMN